MDREIARLQAAVTPQLNPDLANGLAMKHIPEAERYIYKVLRAVEKGFPPELVFLGAERVMPQDEFNELTKKKGSKRTFDVATSYLYMMRYTFMFKGEKIERFLSLPYVTDGGVIMLGGSRFVISPILADRVLSVGMSNIFVRLIRAKVTFERMPQEFYADNKLETVQVAWSTVHNKKAKGGAKAKPIVKAETTLVHYLLCKFGFTEMFKQFGNCQPIIGTHETITRDKYPESDWVICRTAQSHIRTSRTRNYVPTNICLAIPREQYTPMVRNLVCGFFYVVDLFPTRVKPDWVDSKRNWMILMGLILFPANLGDGRLADDIAEHIRSLDEYIDEVMKVKFEEIGLPNDNIYTLFGIVIEHFNEWLQGAADRVSSMYDKEFSILYFVLDEITKQINKFYFKLRAATKREQSANGTKKELTKKDIETMMNQTIKTGLIYSITKKHGEVSTVSSPGDNKAFKITSLLVPQSSSNRQAGRKDNAAANDPSKWFHASVIEVGGYSNLPKSDPSGRARANPHGQLDSKGVFQRRIKYIPLLDSVQEKLRRRLGAVTA